MRGQKGTNLACRGWLREQKKRSSTIGSTSASRPRRVRGGGLQDARYLARVRGRSEIAHECIVNNSDKEGADGLGAASCVKYYDGVGRE
jgi:hypothetical protein